MFNKNTLVIVTVLIIVGLGVFYWQHSPETPEVASFQDCVDAGYPVMESYPRQCQTPDGESFVEDIGNELEKRDLIRVDTPRPNTEVESPVTITGEARGTWYFEASFSVRALTEDGEEIGVVAAEAQDNWMTEEFVPFEATLELEREYEGSGSIVLEKANPSALPENADSLVIPVIFN